MQRVTNKCETKQLQQNNNAKGNNKCETKQYQQQHQEKHENKSVKGRKEKEEDGAQL
jgi:hypothetical protein